MAGRSINEDPDGAFLRKRSENDADLDITPMIDVTFLLLIFFMVTSTMQAEQALDVPVADHGLGIEANSALLVIIRQGEPPLIELPEAGVRDIDDPESSEITSYVETRVKDNRLQVIIKAARQGPHGCVQTVTRQVNNVLQEYDGASFSIAVEDKP